MRTQTTISCLQMAAPQRSMRNAGCAGCECRLELAWSGVRYGSGKVPKRALHYCATNCRKQKVLASLFFKLAAFEQTSDSCNHNKDWDKQWTAKTKGIVGGYNSSTLLRRIQVCDGSYFIVDRGKRKQESVSKMADGPIAPPAIGA